MSQYKDPNSRGTFRDLMRDPSKKRHEAENEIAFLLRDILQTNQFPIAHWENMTERFFTAVYGDDRKAIAQAKINLSRGLAKDKLTWGRFVQSLLVLGFDEYEITVTMKNRGDVKPREHKVKFKNQYKNKRGSKPIPLPDLEDDND